MNNIEKYLQPIIFLTAILLLISNAAAQTSGCTDPQATNYSPAATLNDGSCIYNPGSVVPAATINLGISLNETSGLIVWNNRLWTHNDSEDINIYALDTLNGDILQSYALTGTINNDWEEISQDDDYLYIGDFGNNATGNRQDLKILRVSKISLLANSPEIDEIRFSYSDQTDFRDAGANNTDYDCEAFIISSDSIFLFTKQWISDKTSVYSLPKTPGTYIAEKKSTYDVEGLVTGSVYLEPERLIVLCGYSKLLEPFVLLLYDFNNSNFFNGNRRKISVSLPYHQIEGIATNDGLKYYLTNENFTLNVPQKLHVLNLNPYLEDYLESVSSEMRETELSEEFTVYPVPSGNVVKIRRINQQLREYFSIINFTGQVLLSGRLTEDEDLIDISSLSPGFYILRIGNKTGNRFKLIKD